MIGLGPLAPYTLALKVAAIAVVLAACAGTIIHYGNARADKARADEKALWDADRAQWQAALDKQKAQAGAMLAVAQAQVAAMQRNNEMLHAQQEKDYADHRAATDALHRQLVAAGGLRFVAQVAAPAGCGASRGAAVPGAAAQAAPAASAVVELPASLGRRVLDIGYAADQVRDAYARCYAYVNGL